MARSGAQGGAGGAGCSSDIRAAGDRAIGRCCVGRHGCDQGRDLRRSFTCVTGVLPEACGGFGGSLEEGAVIFPDQAVRIVITTKPADFRKGHDGLAAMAHAELGFAPKTGVMVVFRSKRGDGIKVLFWVSHGSSDHGARAGS